MVSPPAQPLLAALRNRVRHTQALAKSRALVVICRLHQLHQAVLLEDTRPCVRFEGHLLHTQCAVTFRGLHPKPEVRSPGRLTVPFPSPKPELQRISTPKHPETSDSGVCRLPSTAESPAASFFASYGVCRLSSTAETLAAPFFVSSGVWGLQVI